MKILYFTSALSEIDFESLNKLWVNGINPTHQYFHNRFIRMLSLNDEVDVFSKRPFSRSRCRARRLLERERIEGNIKWHYLPIVRFKTWRTIVCHARARKILKNMDLTNAVIFADILNQGISFIAKSMSRKYKIPAIGIVRESPSNILGTTKQYAQRIFSQSHDFDGYICVTNEIDETINSRKRPSLILEGLVEDAATYKQSNEFGKYIFYTGSTAEKYGIFRLITAFKGIKRKDISLVIAGQENKNSKFAHALKEDPRIHFIGMQPNQRILELEQNALCCVNPSPYTEDLTRFCFPQKTLEFLSNNLTITTRNSKVQQNFQDLCLFHDGTSIDSLKKCLEKAINMKDEEKNKLIAGAKKKVNELYSLTAVRKKVFKFAKQFVK